MDETELLIQRFIDHELSPEERVSFLSAVDEDASLRRRWLNIELIVAEAARLPRLAPSAGFAAEVRNRLDKPARGPWQRLIETLTAPRVLQWNVAGVLVAASLAVVAVGIGLRVMPEYREPAQPSDQRAALPEAGREPTVYVRLMLVHPEAESVAVAGDFNGWNAAQTPLERTDGGTWTATIPLKPGRYQYMFVIDGRQWIADPLAGEDTIDGFGSRNAVLDVGTTL